MSNRTLARGAPNVSVGSAAKVDPAWKVRTATMTLLLLSSFAGRILPDTLVVLVATVITILIVVLTRPGVEKVYISISACVAMAWIGATVLWSILPDTTARRAVSFGLVAITATTLGALSPSDNVRAGIRWACLITATASVITIFVAPGWAASGLSDVAAGMRGVAFEKNQLGFIACLGLAAEGLASPSRRRKLSFAVYVIAVVMSKSSTAAAVMMLLFSFLYVNKGRNAIRDRSMKVLYVSTMMAPGVVLFSMLFVAPNALAGIFGKDASLTGRDVIWSTVWSYVTKRPIAGYGWNTVWPVQAGGFLPSEVAYETVRRARFVVINAHNGYLDILLGGGFVALAIFIVIIAMAPGRTPFAYGSLWRTAVVLAFVINSFSESNFNLGFVAILFLLVSSRHNEVPSQIRRALPPEPD